MLLYKCSLLLLNRDYRNGMPVSTLFQEHDCTKQVLERANEYWSDYDKVVKKVFSS